MWMIKYLNQMWISFPIDMLRAMAMLTFLLMLAAMPGALSDEEGVKYPTAVVITDSGKVINVTDEIWKTQIYPALGDRDVTTYKWLTSTKKDYVFFDRSIKGLNPFGQDLLEALSHYDNITMVNAKEAILSIGNLDSDGDGYSNIEELRMGTLPGDPTDTPSWEQENYTPQYGIIIGLIASVVVLHFIFRKSSSS